MHIIRTQQDLDQRLNSPVTLEIVDQLYIPALTHDTFMELKYQGKRNRTLSKRSLDAIKTYLSTLTPGVHMYGSMAAPKLGSYLLGFTHDKALYLSDKEAAFHIAETSQELAKFAGMGMRLHAAPLLQTYKDLIVQP